MARGKDWFIVRTTPGRTLGLAEALRGRGIDAWTPGRTIRRPAPGQRRQLVMGQRRKLVDVDVPILPTFVFVRAEHLAEVVHMMRLPYCTFVVFQFAGRAPLVGEAEVAGLRAEEGALAAAMQAQRDAESREAARRERAEQLRTVRAREKALRRERRSFDAGAEVIVQGMPALTGMTGRIIEGKGSVALIDFGGTLTMKVEAWRVIPVALCDQAALMGAAA